MIKRLNYFVPSGLTVIAMGNGVRRKHFVGIKAQCLFTAAWCLFAFTEDKSVYHSRFGDIRFYFACLKNLTCLSLTKSIDSFKIFFLLKVTEIFFATKFKQKRVKAEAITHTRIAKAFCENARDTREKKPTSSKKY